jgi:hypothetical protein
MQKATAAICYLSSLLFYGMGYSKILVLKNVNVSTYDFTFYVSLATAYFVFAIFSVIIGSLVIYVKTIKDQGFNIIEYRDKAGRRLNNRRRTSTPGVKAQLSHVIYGVDLERRMSS